MKNFKYDKLSTKDGVLRMLIREFVKESIEIANQDLDYASISNNPVDALSPVVISLTDLKLSITPIVQSLDERGLSNMLAGESIQNTTRPLLMFKLNSNISISNIQTSLLLNGTTVEQITTTNRGIDYSSNLYDVNEFESLSLEIKGFVKSGKYENDLDTVVKLTNLVDPSDLVKGAAGYIVEFLFDIKESLIDFTPGKVMPPQNTYIAVHANPSSYDVKISPIGMRLHPVDKVWKMHYGQDISRLSARTLGQDIVAVLPGVVVESRVGEGFGNTIVIKHDEYGNIATRYSHMQNVSDKLVGSKVEIGEVIGNVGNTGKSTAPHLHFTVFSDANTFNDETTAGDPPAILANYPSAIFPITVKMPKK